MRKVVEETKKFLKEHQEDIMLLIGVFLITLFAFATGFIFAERKLANPIKNEYEKESSYHWRRNLWTLSCLEISSKRIQDNSL